MSLETSDTSVVAKGALESRMVTLSPTRNVREPQRLMWWVSLGWAFFPGLVLLVAYLLDVGDHRQVILPWLNVALPETCALYSRFGVDCPGCGLTRSFIHIAHAEPIAAWRLHSLSWFLFAYVAAQIPLALCHFIGLRASWLHRMTHFNQWALVVLSVVLVLRWLWNLAIGELG